MAALIPAFSRVRGRVDPSVFGHVIRLVQRDYLPAGMSDGAQKTRDSYQSIRRYHQAPVVGRPSSSISQPVAAKPIVRRAGSRSYSASAQAVQVDHDEPTVAYHPPNPSLPQRRQPRQRANTFTSDWAHLPPSFASALEDGTITSPVHFRAEFDSAHCKSDQLASVDTLERTFSLFLHAAEPSQWAWLSGQLGHMLASISDAGDLHPDVPALGNSIRAYCLAQLGQGREALTVIRQKMTERRSTLAVDHAIRAIALLHLEELDEAREQLIRAIRRGCRSRAISLTTSATALLTPTLEACFALYANQASDADILRIMRKAGHGAQGHSFRRLLLDPQQYGRHPLFISTWHDWLARAPVSISLDVEDSSFGDLLRRQHMSVLARHTTRSKDALALYLSLEQRGQKLNAAGGSVLALVQLLIRSDMESDARRILDKIAHPATLKNRERSGLLKLYAATDNLPSGREEAESVWKAILDRGGSLGSDRFNIASVRARDGDLAGTVAVLNGVGHADIQEQLRRLTLLFLAAMRAGDAEATEEYFASLINHRKDPRALTQVLQLATRLDRPELAQRFWESYEGAGHQPDVHAYTTLIELHARRREVDQAGMVFGKMLDSPVEPDVGAWTALLDAHTEAGDWDGLASRWDEVPEEYRAVGSIVGIVMKALVLRGVAISQVLDVFRKVNTPTARHWALLLQSASDHGEFTLMEKLFSELDSLSQRSSEAAKPNVFVFSILLHAYLRANDPERSRAIYDDMLRRDILPSSVTYAMIIRSYASVSSGEVGLVRAQEFAMSIYSLFGEGSSHRSRTLNANEAWDTFGKHANTLLSPLVVASGRAGRPQDAERYFDLITQHARPSIVLFTQRLDAWRRAEEPSMVMKIWAELFGLACRTISFSPATKSQTQPSRRQRQPDNAVAIPLTIVLVTLGKDSRLLDIRRVWEEVRSAGFGFDASNFNQLAISLAQSGDVEGAFDVVENVLLDEVDMGEAEHVEGEIASESSAAAPDVLGDTTDSAFRPPNRRVPSIEPLTDIMSTTDVLSPTRQLADPSRDDLWRPHYRTLATLSSVVSQLESNQDKRAWMGLATTEESEDDLDAENETDGSAVVQLPEFNTCVRDSQNGRPKRTSARGLLMKLNRKYSKAMALVMFHRKKQSAGAAKRGYSSGKRAGVKGV